MKRGITRKIVMALAAVGVVGAMFSGCGKKEAVGDTSKGNNEVKQSIMVLGSSALQPLAEVAAKDFMKDNSNKKINVQGGGSGAGIKSVLEGSADIGNSDVKAEVKLGDSPDAKKLVDHEVCGIGFAMVVSKDVTVDSLTKEQIKDIFTGKITNWKEVGGEDKEIVLIHRKSSSGTRLTFIDRIMEGEKEDASIGITKPESGAVREAIKVTDGAISYLGLSYLSDSVKEDVKPLKINGVEPTNESIIAKKYDFWAFEHMYTKGEAEGLEKEFIDYMISDENASNVTSLGYIPMNELR